jgi:hypothetical protein
MTQLQDPRTVETAVAMVAMVAALASLVGLKKFGLGWLVFQDWGAPSSFLQFVVSHAYSAGVLRAVRSASNGSC